jgi:membrane-bound metal-dependent hydrolase YbcI (DUF457 family)
MPSPIGHALAGVAVAWAGDLVPGNRAWRSVSGPASWYERAGGGLTLVCAGLAASPDLDLAFVAHRTVTHSLFAVCVVGLVAAVVAARTRRPVARIALMCAAAYGSHLLMDWLGTDHYPPPGLQVFWPIGRYYISGFDVFRQTQRFYLFSRETLYTNITALVQEVAILVPTATVLWLVRVKALAGLAPQVPRRHHPPL